MPRPTAYRERRPSTKPKTDTKKKLVALTWRELRLEPDQWQTDTVTVTGYSVNSAGCLTLFCAGIVLRILAPGYWRDIEFVAFLEDIGAQAVAQEGHDVDA